MGNDKIQGVIAPMLTPCHADGSLDQKGIEAYFEFLANTKAVTSVFVRSGMGKMFTFKVPEVEQIAQVALKAGRRYGLGVIVGAMGEWLDYREGKKAAPDKFLKQTLHLIEYCGKLGVDGVMLVIPYMLPVTSNADPQKIVLDYFRAANQVANLPVCFYQPHSTPHEYRLTPQSIEQILALKWFRGAKVAAFEWQAGQDRIAAMNEWRKRTAGSHFQLICGDEACYYPVLEAGGVGVIGEGCNAYPEILHAMRTAWQKGDHERAATTQEDVNRGLQIASDTNGAMAWKQVMIRRGLKVQPFDREGTAPYPDEKIKQMTEQLERLLEGYQ